MLRRLTDDEVNATYGNVLRFVQDDGRLTPIWAATQLTRILLPSPLPFIGGGVTRRVLCHRLVAKELSDIFATIATDKTAWASINDWGGCFEFRRNRNNPRVLSRHCWGIAVDLDTADNPNKDTNITPDQMHPFIIETFANAGWMWGGTFIHSPDPMHFEKAVKL